MKTRTIPEIVAELAAMLPQGTSMIVPSSAGATKKPKKEEAEEEETQEEVEEEKEEEVEEEEEDEKTDDDKEEKEEKEEEEGEEEETWKKGDKCSITVKKKEKTGKIVKIDIEGEKISIKFPDGTVGTFPAEDVLLPSEDEEEEEKEEEAEGEKEEEEAEGEKEEEEAEGVNEETEEEEEEKPKGDLEVLGLPKKIVDLLTEAGIDSVDAVKEGIADGTIEEIEGLPPKGLSIIREAMKKVMGKAKPKGKAK